MSHLDPDPKITALQSSRILTRRTGWGKANPPRRSGSAYGIDDAQGSDPADGSRHNRGCAVDLTLFDLGTGLPVSMPSGYDEFSHSAHSDYTGGSEEQRRHRDRLRSAMEAEGFTVYPEEWWHYDYRDWQHYPILNVTFEELGP
ncbi:M15 family metallopeptidase [Elongatibacter sediminis]|uniref:M15 family metallopeptidase n=1 Tax=Elongatibacter sediminis TaxID=3119006 RepID=A0AAW9R6U5_9GAMM